MRQGSLLQRFWYRFAKSMVQIAVSILFRPRFTGRENIPASGGALLISNHQSHLDPPMVGVGCPRQLSFLARRTLFLSFPFGWLIESLGAIPIDRDGSALAGIRATMAALRNDQIVLLFPEGTRTRDGNVGSFKPGLAMLARRSGVPVIPAAIEGAFDAWPYKAPLPRPRTIHVHYGRPITPEEIRACSEKEFGELVERRVRECFELLCQRPEFARKHEKPPKP